MLSLPFCNDSTKFLKFALISDLQILSVKMHQKFQEEKEPAKGKMDQGFPEERREGVGC